MAGVLGADVIIAQETEAGGHGALRGRSRLPFDPLITRAIIEGRGQETERSTILDIARGAPWPAKYPGRSLAHPYLGSGGAEKPISVPTKKPNAC